MEYHQILLKDETIKLGIDNTTFLSWRRSVLLEYMFDAIIYRE